MIQERGDFTQVLSQWCRKFLTPGERVERITGFIQPRPLFVRRHTHLSSPLASPSVPHCPTLLPTSSKSLFDGFPSNLSTAGMCVTHPHTTHTHARAPLTQNSLSRQSHTITVTHIMSESIDSGSISQPTACNAATVSCSHKLTN